MRIIIPILLIVGIAGCDFFSEPDNRRPRISWAQMFAEDTLDAFQVTMRAGASDPDRNLEGIDCEGDLSYSGPSPVDTTVAFPYSDAGEEIFSNCIATDTDGATSEPVRLFTFLPAPETSSSAAGTAVK